MAGPRQGGSSPREPKPVRDFDRCRVQDEDRDDRAPSDYEREIDRLDAAARAEH